MPLLQMLTSSYVSSFFVALVLVELEIDNVKIRFYLLSLQSSATRPLKCLMPILCGTFILEFLIAFARYINRLLAFQTRKLLVMRAGNITVELRAARTHSPCSKPWLGRCACDRECCSSPGAIVRSQRVPADGLETASRRSDEMYVQERCGCN